MEIREVKKCRRCQKDDVEDEVHISKCLAYAEVRDQYNINQQTNKEVIEAVKAAKPSLWYQCLAI